MTPFARTSKNIGVVRVSGVKMAKSSGNLVLAGDLLKDYPAAAIRLLILDRRWDEDWDYDRAGLDAVHEALFGDLDVPAALHVAEDSGGQAARVLGSLLGLW